MPQATPDPAGNWPPPLIEEIDGFHIIRDDLLPGGTKLRIIPEFLTGADEFVYASPVYGFAQIALAWSCRQAGKKAIIFVAKRKKMHPRTLEAKRAGATIIEVPNGYLSHVTARAKGFCRVSGAKLLPFGLDFPQFSRRMTDLARSLQIDPPEVWCVVGSGTLCRALQRAWPAADFHAVFVGAKSLIRKATTYTAPEPFQDDARQPPPFPSCSNYDAKAWQFMKQHARPGAYFWNVAA